MLGLTEKKVIVTGAAGGIGKACVQRFLSEGCRVAALDRNAEGLNVLASLSQPPELIFNLDITNRSSLSQVFGQIQEKWNTVDILINNAGISVRALATETSNESWIEVLNTNLNGVFYCARESYPLMNKMGGVIINMGSVNGMVGMPFYASYNAAKAGVIELTRTLALEWAPSIRVVCLCPGYVLTPMQYAEYSAEQMAVLNARIPLGRHAFPEEIAALCAFIASDEAPILTGCTVVADGGETAGGLAS